jgi:hypothetical protein
METFVLRNQIVVRQCAMVRKGYQSVLWSARDTKGEESSQRG